MDQRTQYLIQMLEKIGAPLMGAISHVAGPGPLEPAQDAQKMAALLGKAVQASIEMGNATDLARAGVQDDSVRVALAGLAGPLIAGQFRASGKIPGDAEIKRLVTALQAVMTFSENFTPSPENTSRLQKIAADATLTDIHQMHVQYIHAFIPVVNAIGVFSYGQSEQKLIMEVANRLVSKAAELREALAPGLAEDDQKLTELAMLRALGQLYAACHGAETQRLSSLSAEDPAGLSMDPLWRAFDTRAMMLETLIKTILPGSAQGARSSGGGPVPASAPAPIAQPQQAVPIQTPPPPASPPPAQQQAGNPMAMFSSKPQTETPPTQPPPTPPPAAPPPPSAPSQPETPPGGNPMTFFKPKDNNDGE